MNHSFNFEDFLTLGESFFKSIIGEMESLGIRTSQIQADHLCFRVSTLDEYLFYKNELEKTEVFLTESEVNGRPIATFQLHTSFKAGNQSVSILELPAPKEGSPYAKGFEHVEFVISQTMDQFSSQFPHLSFVRSGNKNLNPELCLKTKAGQVKFHYLPLQRVVEIEKAGITDIIFDFDGTIIKSRDHIFEINRRVFSEVLDRNVSIEESILKFHTEFPKLFEAFGVECPELRGKALDRWSCISQDFSFDLFEGAEKLLHRVAKSPVNLHLWTARDEESTRKILRRHGLETLFKTMSFSNVDHPKPHSKSLTFNWCEAAKNSYLVVGDSSTDMVGAKKIGAISVAALWCKHSRESLLVGSGAEAYFYAVDEFEKWISEKIGT